MKKGSIITILLGALLAFALVGCEEEDAAAGEPVDEGMISGSWVIDEDATFGITGSLVFDEEGVELVVGGESYVGTWSIDEGKASVTMEGQQAVSAIYSDGKLTLGNDGASRIVFVKGEGTTEEAEGDAPAGEDEGEGAVEGGEQPEEAAPADEGDDEEEAVDENVEPELVEEVISDIDPVVIADDDACSIVVTGRGTDYTADPCYRISFTNKTGSPLYITAEDDFDVNGTTVLAGIDDIADPGETIETELYFPADELGGGLDKLVNVNGVINVQIDDTYEPVADYAFHMD